MARPDLTDGLNAPQRDAVNTLAGPMLVLAGAGTGKTRVVTFRIAQLIRSGVAADRILAVTFTNKAAREMKERAGTLLGSRRKQKPEISTFHSLCVRILRRHIRRLGYPERFAIYDRGDQESMARQALREIKSPNDALRPGDLIYQIGVWKNQGVSPDAARTVAESDKQHLAAVAYRRYQDGLRLRGAVDFDDLLRLTEALFEQFADVRREEATRFDQLLVDEYQDTNGSQYRIIRALAAGHRNLCVVGDDDQSIYGWRGAEVQHILRFKIDWPDAKVVRLENNYRSRPEILEVANRLIAFNRHRHEKLLRAARPGGRPPRILQFQDENAEAREVIGDIRQVLRHPDAQPRDIAILFRTNEQPRPFETELRRVGLPYILIGGMSFFDRREVRDILAYFKVISCPQDEVSLLRILNNPPRGISASTVRILTDHAVQCGKTLWDVLPAAAHIPGLRPQALQAVESFRLQMQHFQTAFRRPKCLVDTASRMIETIGYRRDLKQRYPDPNDEESRWNAVEQIVNAMGNYEAQTKKATLEGFLDATLLDHRSEDKESQLQQNSIALMTLHSAKGLEFPHVYLVGLEEGLLPHRRSVDSGDESQIEEERRLCYVGLTRAQDRLTISLALSRRKWGKARDSIPSRFLYELTGQADHPNASNVRKTPSTQQQKQGLRPAAARPAHR